MLTAGPQAPARPGAPAGPGALPEAGPAAGTVRELCQLLDDRIAAGMARYAIPGVAVGVWYRGHQHLRGFGVADARRGAPVEPDTVFRVGSTTKTFTGTVIMRLAAAGRLDLDAEVRRCLPGFRPPPGAETVTVRQLLNHTAGWLGDDFHDTGRGWDALPRYLARLRTLPQLTAPGTVFAYNNAAFAVAGKLIEQVSGQSYERAVRDLLLRPLGLRQSFLFADEIIGQHIAAPHVPVRGKPVLLPGLWRVPRSINAAGGLMSSAADQLRWARFHLGDGRAPDGTPVLPHAALAAMRTGAGPGGTLVTELTGMGVSWMLRPTAQGALVLQHGGHWPGQVSGLLLVPGHDFALTLLTNSESGNLLVNELFADDWALRMFTGLANLPAAECRLSPAELAPYLGSYTLQQVDAAGRLVDQPAATVTARDGGLQLSAGPAPVLLLTFYDSPAGPGHFLVKDAGGTPTGLRGDFIRDAGGRVRWLRLSGRLHRHQR
ncbi:MAG: serine hydrolase domain-containing protein [Gemmatimonadota bacterium]